MKTPTICFLAIFPIFIALSHNSALADERPTNSADRPGSALLSPEVADLRFGEFFEMPVGPRGLKPGERLLRLDAKKVRILGYMAKQEEPVPGMFILAPLPVSMAEAADGPADDLPPAVLFVHMATESDKVVPYTPGLLMVTGALAVGPQEEVGGRVSYVRLALDPPALVVRATAAK